MKRKKFFQSVFLVSVVIIMVNTHLAKAQETPSPKAVYDSSWSSLSHYKAPEWYEDAKIGYWVHWGVYSVPAFSGDHAAEWYGRWMYSKDGQSENNR